MERLNPPQIFNFLRRFRFKGGMLRRFQIHNHSPNESSGDLRVLVREGEQAKPKRLRLQFAGVEEFRFQRRPGPGLLRLKEVRLGHFNGLFYLNLDAFADDGPLAVHDFRASDAFIAAKEISWEITVRKSPPPA